MHDVTKRRLGLALVAHACLVGQLSAFAHRALVQHGTCAEHGESVHIAAAGPAASGVARTAAAAPAAGQSEDRTLARVGAIAIASADEHDHCAVVLSRALATQAPAATIAAALPVSGGLDRAPEIVAISGAPTYLLAPKTSPPRRCC